MPRSYRPPGNVVHLSDVWHHHLFPPSFLRPLPIEFPLASLQRPLTIPGSLSPPLATSSCQTTRYTMHCQSSPHSGPHIAVVAGAAAAVSGLFVCFHTAPLSQATCTPFLSASSRGTCDDTGHSTSIAYLYIALSAWPRPSSEEYSPLFPLPNPSHTFACPSLKSFLATFRTSLALFQPLSPSLHCFSSGSQTH